MTPTSIARWEGRSFTAAGLLIGAYLVARTLEVPWTEEEARRHLQWVVRPGLPPDHLWSVLWSKLLGSSLVVARLLALLCFPLFLRYAFLLGGLVEHAVVRRSLWAALLCMPFAVETFALAGGHGPAMALLLMGLWHLLRTGHAPHHTWAAAAAFGLAALSVKALWPLWAIGLPAVLWAGYRVAGLKGAWGVVPGVLVPVLWLLAPAGNMTDTTHNGLVRTVRNWLELVLGSGAHTVLWVLIGAVAAMGYLAYLHPRWKGSDRLRLLLRTLVPMLALWPATLLIGGLSSDLRHDLLPWLPLFLLGWAVAVDEAAAAAPHRRWLALLLLAPASVMLATIHVGTTRASGDGAVPRQLVERAQALQREAGRALMVAGGLRQAPSWDLGIRGAANPLSSLRTAPESGPLADLLVVHRDAVQGLEGFTEVAHGHGGLVLLARMPMLERTVVHTADVEEGPITQEFHELPLPVVEQLAGRDLVADLHGQWTMEALPKEGPFLVVEMNDADMAHLHYSSMPLLQMPSQPSDPAGRITFALPPVPPEAQRVAIYIWNPGGKPLAAKNARLQLLERPQPAE